MECNRDEAHKAKEIAERKFTAKDVAGAKKFALKAQNLFPALEGIAQMIATIDVHVAAEELINGEKDWYGILCVNASADDEMVKKQYRRLALMLHPDKNKSIGAEAAFKLVSEAWSILSDKTRRMAYDQKRIVKFAGQKVKKSHASSNGFHHFPSHPSSNLRAQKNTARSGPPPACPTRPTTFWTSCNRCKMQYEYLRVYLNHNLLCPNCHEPFLAVETGNPTNGHNPTVHWSSSHLQQSQNINRNLYGSGKNSSSATGSTGFTPSHGANHSYKKVTKQWDAKQRTTAGNEAVHQKNVQKRMASNVTAGDASFDRKHPSSSSTERPAKRRSISDAAGLNDFTRNRSVGETSTCNENKGSSFSTVFPAEKANVPGARMISRQSNHSSRDLSSLDIRNMLIERAKHLLLGKLDEWKSAAAAKLAEKEKAKQKQKLKSAEKEKENTLLHRGAITAHKEENEVNKSSNLNRETPSEKVSSDHPYNESDKEASEPVSIDVPDPDFHDFDKDRSEKAFEPNQVWATYDDEDGMPRFYVLVQKVISLKPFKIRMSFLNSKTNSELGPMHWVGMGFAKTCGDFRVGRYELNDHINIFSHKVRWEKGARGVIRIIPQKGDIWAVYRNWSPDWNEHTPDEIIYKYDMVEVLNDYNEQGITVARLVKLAGFKTVFYRQLDPKVVERIPREEMFRFSHQVPSYLLTGTESKNVPKGCHELDPAATPLELLQVALHCALLILHRHTSVLLLQKLSVGYAATDSISDIWNDTTFLFNIDGLTILKFKPSILCTKLQMHMFDDVAPKSLEFLCKLLIS